MIVCAPRNHSPVKVQWVAKEPRFAPTFRRSASRQIRGRRRNFPYPALGRAVVWALPQLPDAAVSFRIRPGEPCRTQAFRRPM